MSEVNIKADEIVRRAQDLGYFAGLDESWKFVKAVLGQVESLDAFGTELTFEQKYNEIFQYLKSMDDTLTKGRLEMLDDLRKLWNVKYNPSTESFIISAKEEEDGDVDTDTRSADEEKDSK